MYIEELTLDDLLHEVFEELLTRPFNLKATRGDTSEVFGALLTLKNPRARLSRTEIKGTPFSALGELLWYLSKKNDLDFITHYIPLYKMESEDNKTVYGGYGSRLFNFRGKFNQIKNVIRLLKERPTTRRAVIQLFDAKDIASKRKEIPCTCSMQFLIRDGKLHMITHMRSNDAYLGLPHDIFTFTMIQEIIARSIGVNLGEYKHSVGSLHMYKKHTESVKKYLDEGFQSTKIKMPAMPDSNPWLAIASVLRAEAKIRRSEKVDLFRFKQAPYWLDLIRLLQIHTLFKNKDYQSIEEIKRNFVHQEYQSYVEKRLINNLQKI